MNIWKEYEKRLRDYNKEHLLSDSFENVISSIEQMAVIQRLKKTLIVIDSKREAQISNEVENKLICYE